MSSQFVYVPTVRYFSSTKLSKILGIEKNYRGLACGKISIINDIVFKFIAQLEFLKIFETSCSFGDWAVTGFGLSDLRSVAEKLFGNHFSNLHKKSVMTGHSTVDSQNTCLYLISSL